MPDGKTIHAVVAVPNYKLFEGDVYYASVPGVEGQFGVLPGHELLMSLTLQGGICTLYTNEAKTESVEILLNDGVADIMDDKLIVLGKLGKLTSRINGQEMTERAAAQAQLVENLKTQSSSDDVTENEIRAKLEEEEYRLKWYQIQVDWAKKNNK